VGVPHGQGVALVFEHTQVLGRVALALADDATGALETGARFREAGLDARVIFEPDRKWSCDAPVIDTETRHQSGVRARAVIREIGSRAREAGAGRVFKKTDSTLRGPLAAEFSALFDVWPELPLVYAPAYPALGRSVRNGELLVDGRPLNRTPFAADLLNPSRESSIAALLSETGAGIVVVRNPAELRAALFPGGIFVCDGETETDLEDVAEALRGARCLVAGTAAMASVWARSLWGGSVSSERRRVLRQSFAAATCLIVNGSLHPASRDQLAASGIPMVTHNPAADPLELGTQLAGSIAQNRWAAVCASPAPAAEPLAVAAHIARAAAHAIRLAAPECLMVFGGDTVFAILRELDIDEAEPHFEMLPGAPVSTIAGQGTARRMVLVTKAGGFGAPDYLVRIREILERA